MSAQRPSRATSCPPCRRGDCEVSAISALTRSSSTLTRWGQGFNRTSAEDETRTRDPHPEKEVISFWSAWRR